MQLRARTAPQLSLRRILPEATLIGAADLRIAGCSHDARRCQGGDLFVLADAHRADAMSQVNEAVRRGATGVLAERPFVGSVVPMCVVDDARAAWGRVCQALAGNPAEQLSLVGVAGTLGKTTAALLVSNVLHAGGLQTGLLSSLGYCDGEETVAADHTALSPHVLAPWLARIERCGATHAVLEAGDSALESQTLSGASLDVACVTNLLAPGLRSAGAPWRASAGVLELLVPEGVAIFNVDDPGVQRIVHNYAGPALTVGLHESAEVTATIVEQRAHEQTFLLCCGDETVPVRTTLLGEHHVRHCLLAAAVGLVYGIPVERIARGLEALDRVPGRLERVECGQPFGVFVDSASSPEALACVLDALRAVTAGRLICVATPVASTAARAGRWLKTLQRGADVAVLSAAGSAASLRASATNESGGTLCWAPDRQRAIRHALDEATAGDCVLIVSPADHPTPRADTLTAYEQVRAFLRHDYPSWPAAARYVA